MRKSDLKTGMIVEQQRGKRGLVIKDAYSHYDRGKNVIVYSVNDYTMLDSWNEDLTTALNLDGHDIVKVYESSLPHGILGFETLSGGASTYETIWERKDNIREFTLSEVAKSLGIPLHLLRIKD